MKKGEGYDHWKIRAHITWCRKVQFAGKLHTEGFILSRVRQGDGRANRRFEDMGGGQITGRLLNAGFIDINRHFVLGTRQG